MAKKKATTTRLNAAFYKPLISRMSKLTPGKTTTAKRPEGVDGPTFLNRVNAAWRRAGIKPPARYRFAMNSSETGITVSLARK